MLPLLVAMQVVQPDPAAAQPGPATPPPPPAQQQQHSYPYGYPYAYPPPEAQRPRKKADPDRPVTWFVRAAVGLGPPGFSEQTSLLKLEGYGGAKFWAMADGGWMFHENVGIGAWAGLSLWSSSPGNSPGLSENSYFLGPALPLKLGSRSISVVLSPRIAWGTGQLEVLGDAAFQHAFTFGADLAVTSFRYHIGGHIGILRAAVDPPGAIGRDHDYGGLYFLIGGSIDG